MGSLAVEQIINFPTNPDDIDIQLKKPDFENFEQLTSLMEELGYRSLTYMSINLKKLAFMLALQAWRPLKTMPGLTI